MPGGARRSAELLDTTLRDGAQMQGVSFSVEDKIRIARCLDDIGIACIEAGNPGSNPKDLEFFGRAAAIRLKNSALVAFGSTRRAGAAAIDDANLAAVIKSGAPVAAIVGKCWDFHVREVLNATNDENLRMIYDSVRRLRDAGLRVIFDAEHFFDGYAADPAYAIEALEAAYSAGADTLCLCDTNGGAFPSRVYKAASAVVGRFEGRFDRRYEVGPDARPEAGLAGRQPGLEPRRPVAIGIHCHNDGGMAVASTIAAYEAGASHIQGTFNGYGERCGNADLCSVIPNLQLKAGCDCIPEECLARLTDVSLRIGEIANIPHDGSSPYVGGHAFAHKGGMHIDGVGKAPSTFEHVDPALVGNARNFLLSEISGRSYILRKLGNIAPGVGKDSPIARKVVERLKELEFEGYQFEAAEASFELEINKLLGLYKPHFSLIEFKVVVSEPSVSGIGSTAFIKIRVGGQDEITADEGDGPVDALDRAIRKAMERFYPQIANMKLTDYKVRVIDSGAATAAKVRVLIESTDGDSSWTTIGVSSDIILASWKALVDSMEYMLMKNK